MSTSTTSTESLSPLSSDSLLTEPLLSAKLLSCHGKKGDHQDEEMDDNNSFVLLSSSSSSSSSFPDIHDGTSYVLDPKRFVALTLFSLNNLLPSACWITFAPIEDAVRVYYGGITAQQVNWLSTIMMAAYGPGTLMAAWAIPKFGMRFTVVASSILISVGAILRWLSVFAIASHPTLAYQMVLCGQAIASLGQCVFCNAPARLASTWFSKTTQPIATVVLSGTVGMAVAQAMSPLLVEESTGAHLDQLLAGQALVIGLCTIATWWWFESQPALPPSAAEAARRQRQQSTSYSQTDDSTATGGGALTSITEDVWKLAKDPQMQLLLTCFGIGYGVNNACLTLLQPWIASSGYKGDKIAGLCGSLSIVGGVVGNLIAAPLLEATQNYNQAIRWSYGVSFGVVVATVAALQVLAPVWMLATVFFALGMSQLPLMTIAMDAAAAHSYPIPEDLSSAALQMIGQYLGVVLVDILGGMIHEDGPRGFAAPVNMAFLALVGLASIVALCYNGVDNRAAANGRTIDSNVDMENGEG